MRFPATFGIGGLWAIEASIVHDWKRALFPVLAGGGPSFSSCFRRGRRVGQSAV
jgi:hypothetical protein